MQAMCRAGPGLNLIFVKDCKRQVSGTSRADDGDYRSNGPVGEPHSRGKLRCDLTLLKLPGRQLVLDFHQVHADADWGANHGHPEVDVSDLRSLRGGLLLPNKKRSAYRSQST